MKVSVLMEALAAFSEVDMSRPAFNNSSSRWSNKQLNSRQVSMSSTGAILTNSSSQGVEIRPTPANLKDSIQVETIVRVL